MNNSLPRNDGTMAEPSRPPNAAENSSRRLLLLGIAYLGFISLGLPDAVTGVAWLQLRATFQQPESALGYISVTLAVGYFLSSFFAGQLQNVLGIGLLLTFSSLLVAVAMFGNALAPTFLVILICVALWGLGSGAIDAGLNHYAASHFSPRHMNWLHACYSLGATLGPFLMTASIVGFDSWRLGYGLVGAVVLSLTILFAATLRLWSDPQTPAPADSLPQPAESPVSILAALANPLVHLQVVIFFLYTGLEFMIGNWCFTLLTQSRGATELTAGMLVGTYYGSVGVGRVALGGLTRWVGVDQLVRMSTVAAVIGTLLFAFAPHPLSFVGLVLLGLGLAPIFPCLMSRTPARLGKNMAAHAVGFQVSAATIGGASLTYAGGELARVAGREAIPQLGVAVAIAIWLLHEVLLRVTAGRESAR
jgi:fucose permease